ncbi:MAG: tyrosine-type recombinase/integrase [Thaumarchaeota archaeon]|nr:tyrosine-type recombinase/integrase [Nitrososphaerota archaeon]
MDFIRNYSEKFEKFEKRLKDIELSRTNKLLLKNFSDYLLASGISKGRVLKYASHLIHIVKILGKDLDKASREDLIKVIGEIEKKNYSAWTKHDYKVALKKFYKWLKGEQEGRAFTDWFKVTVKNNNKKLPEELLSVEDIEKLASASSNLRDKAFVLALYESGARIGEFLPIKIKQVEFDRYGALLTLHGKTGSRKIRLITCVPALIQWLDSHPCKNDKEAFVWVKVKANNGNEIITYAEACKILKELAKKAGISKPVNPHHFRHSRATELAKHLTEAQLCEYLGWVQGSDEANTYVHLSQRDIESAILKLHGIEVEEEKELEFKPIVCPRCKKQNSPGSKFCSLCGLALDLKSAIELDSKLESMAEIFASLLEDSKTRRMIVREALRKGLKIR